MAMATRAVVGVCGASLQARPAQKSGFMGSAVARPTKLTVAATRRSTIVAVASQEFNRGWLNPNPIVLVAGFLGWTVPANIPVSAFGGNSLFGLFTASIGQELSHFPTGPSLDSPFWLYLVTYHAGLFLALTLGQIGVNGRRQGYFQ